MKKYFNSNETLEMCDVKVAEDGRIEIQTKPYHAPELARLGCPPNPTHSIRGRVTRIFILTQKAQKSQRFCGSPRPRASGLCTLG